MNKRQAVTNNRLTVAKLEEDFGAIFIANAMTSQLTIDKEQTIIINVKSASLSSIRFNSYMLNDCH